ncbi:uncharacterized protein A4U43_C07F20220 [Asparagus officinalis]|uniref:SET domain-containing protein n=1 Tax=Asparagus officinalis TaxID=4686 RepID=A0A5P1EDL7_ASPOF|nr:probable inactive histone-lysine N-methyltransferase SUVR1 isoform X1 [Asparagus officinalis]XP_020271979.1 probable inactive histone-lysine N-methyltransferase SUVR1 isoform X2 [Asparagus officinalis]XP_020271980.1 probable inactive histone-lysine N-methyltransferase SUVR1 isoform X3 [Asparagus officinalis]ONK63914.1 uncharacterized protein A4U43_C07F20220 [Asparagus officinalis]
MAPPPRARSALQAMKNLGFSSKVAAPLLKKLLEVYDNNWQLIEDNGYQVLIDSILEEQELKATAGKKQDAVADEDAEVSRKRLRQQSENTASSLMLGPDSPSSKKLRVEADCSLGALLRQRRAEPVLPQVEDMGRLVLASPQEERDEHDTPLISRRETRASAHARRASFAQENVESISLLTYGRCEKTIGEASSSVIMLKEPKIEPGTEVLDNSNVHSPSTSKSKQADSDPPEFEVPIAMILPDHPLAAGNEVHQCQHSQGETSPRDMSSLQENDVESLAAQTEAKNADKAKRNGSLSDNASNGKASELVTSQGASSTTVDIASSDTGAVKLQFSFNSGSPDLPLPSIDAFFKMVEDRCLKSYKFLPSDFSLLKVMKEMCQVASDLTVEPSYDRQETPTLSVNDSVGGSTRQTVDRHKEDRQEKGKENVAPEHSNLKVVQYPQTALGDLRPPHDPTDITRGEERIPISLVNEVSNERYPSHFYYIPRNLIYQNAYVNFSLARIGDEDCCSDCYGDCLAATIPCPCARETGGEYAYTCKGLVKESFLDECISMNCNPHKHQHVYCQDCPLERPKSGDAPGKCKGHLVRKFIKECWSKCGCSMQCKNRIIQRGITCNLQVFFTPEGKGWGLRTLDELPKGTFVCEYVGEVLTNIELYNRTIQSTGNARHTYPVLLDADWGSEGVLKDEEALCLDATFYGNVARFVNHRCVDANMVEIPVEVETPDRHYYHLAFFTARKIEKNEELTWDYGIDFSDVSHPVKAFKCRCGSKFCRDMKRSRARSKALVLR